jgi:hypothetical protein
MDSAPKTQPSERRSFLKPLIAAVLIASVGFCAVFLLFGYLPYLFLTSARAEAFLPAMHGRMPILIVFVCSSNMALTTSGCLFLMRRQSRHASRRTFFRLD